MSRHYDFKDTDSKYAYGGALGALYSHEKTVFAVWSPYAESVALRLYDSDISPSPSSETAMTLGESGVWRCSVSGDLDGVYYTYLVRHGGRLREAPDIYCRSAGINGRRGMIFSPESVMIDGWERDRPLPLKSPADAVIYELHIRDLSMDENGGFKLRGKFGALCEAGAANIHGDPIGLDHLEYMGITHVHLLPIMDFASVDEERPVFNWGYDPLHYNVPEGSYSVDPHDGHSRVRELRQLVTTLHKRGIGVILDVVYNHTYNTEKSPFNAIFPHYYYRHRGAKYSDGSGCGNELASERRMMRRFIRDSLCALAEDYHLDGFRFDLMGLMDIKTLKLCAAELRRINPDILLYGEGWTGGISPLPDERRALKHNAELIEGVAMFSDDFRDGVKGSVFDDTDCGYINGVATTERRELIKSVLCGGVYHPEIDREERQCWAKTPLHCVNYTESHDNLTFHDKLTLSMPNASEEERVRVNKLGAALIFLAQGIPFIQAGQELLRSKPLPEGGFDRNSYSSPDSVNCIKWNDVTEKRDVMEYYRGLIAVRKAYPEFRMTSAEEVRKIRFEDLEGGGFAMLTGELVLLVNPHTEAAELALDGDYGILADDTRASAVPFGFVSGRAAAAPQSILLLKRRGVDNVRRL